MTARQIKSLYDRGENVMKALRESGAEHVNSREAIQVSYDLQAGSYVEALKNPERLEQQTLYAAAVARMLDSYGPQTLLEAGVGEATTLANVVRQMQERPKHVLGFDIAWSRVAVGGRYLQEQGVSAQLLMGELESIPVADNSVDTVFTSHAIEPNRGREKAILRELFRVARRYLILFEPSNELGTEGTRRHMEEHRYCLDLRRHADELGFLVVQHKLMEHVSNPRNQTAVLVIAKEPDSAPYLGEFLACPTCHTHLELQAGHYWCPECLVVYPVLAGVPCLLRTNAVLATRYRELA